MLSDLDQLRQPPDPRLTLRPKGKATKSWLSITGSNDDDLLEAWYQRTARALAADPAWTAWWQSSGLDRLVLYPSAIGPPGHDHTTYHRNKSWLHVVGSSAELSKLSWTILETDDDDADAPASGFHTPDGPALMTALTYRLLKRHILRTRAGTPAPARLMPWQAARSGVIRRLSAQARHTDRAPRTASARRSVCVRGGACARTWAVRYTGRVTLIDHLLNGDTTSPPTTNRWT